MRALMDDLASGRHTIHTRHTQIHDDEVWLEFEGQAYGFLAGPCFARHFEAFFGAEQRAQTRAKHRVVIGNEHA